MKDRILDFGLKIVEWSCSIDYLEMVQGDLIEIYNYRIQKVGFNRASFHFIKDCIVSIYIFFSQGHSQYSINKVDMIRINLITAIRNISRNKLTSSISILGLVLGLTSTILILQYIHYELSFDTYHPNPANLYRASMNIISKENVSGSAGTYYGLGENAKSAFPEIKKYFTASFNMGDQSQLLYKKGKHVHFNKVKNVYYADPNILEMFKFDLIEGSFDNALSGTRNAVMTSTLAQRTFPGGSPIGQTVYWNETPFEIVAVIEDQPENSHFIFDLILPMDEFRHSTPEYSEMMWRWYGYYNYYELEAGADVDALEAKFDDFVRRNMGEKPYFIDVFLQPITSIHLGPQLLHEQGVIGNNNTINLLRIIALLIIVIAYTNFVNLTISSNLQRAKEIGIRKVLGSSRRLLIRQLITQSLLINFLAGVLAILLIYTLEGFLSEFIGHFPDFYLGNGWEFWIVYIVLIAILGLVSGIYPAYLVTNQNSILVLKGVFIRSAKGISVHKYLVIVQFLIASIMILFTIVVNRQLHFMLSQDLGTNIHQTMVLKAPLTGQENSESKLKAFKNELEQNADLTLVSYTTSLPGQPTYGNSIRRLSNKEDSYVVSRIVADEDYLPLYEIRLLAGRNFRAPFQIDETGIIINERVTQLLDIEPKNIINQKLIMSGDTVQVLGVIANYHHSSMHSEYEPIVISYAHDMQYITHLSVRISSSNYGQVINDVQQAWNVHFPTRLFDFFFADEAFNKQYNQEQELTKIINVFSVIAIFIACLGLYALSMFSVMRRRKEVSIRKVLGTPGISLFWMLVKGTLGLIILSGVIAIPISYWIADGWLSKFAYRINVQVTYLLMPMLVTIILSMLTVGYNIMRAMLINPVEILRED